MQNSFGQRSIAVSKLSLCGDNFKTSGKQSYQQQLIVKVVNRGNNRKYFVLLIFLYINFNVDKIFKIVTGLHLFEPTFQRFFKGRKGPQDPPLKN